VHRAGEGAHRSHGGQPESAQRGVPLLVPARVLALALLLVLLLVLALALRELLLQALLLLASGISAAGSSVSEESLPSIASRIASASAPCVFSA